jgi:hypothetical protein
VRKKAAHASIRLATTQARRSRGKKRNLLVDTQGLLMCAIVHAADIQDRDGGLLLMGARFGLYPFLLKLYADSGYQGPKFKDGLKHVCRQINLEIVKRSDVVVSRITLSSGPAIAEFDGLPASASRLL